MIVGEHENSVPPMAIRPWLKSGKRSHVQTQENVIPYSSLGTKGSSFGFIRHTVKFNAAATVTQAR